MHPFSLFFYYFAAQYNKSLDNVRENAAMDNVSDCAAAMRHLECAESDPAVALSPLAQLVEVEMMIASNGDLVKHKALFPLQLSGNSGIHVFKRANDTAAMAKLRAKEEKLRAKLEMGIEELTDEQKKQGLEELQRHILKRLRFQVEQQIFKRKLILAEMEKVESNKNSTNLAKRLESIAKIIKDYLPVIETWNVIGSDASPRSISDSAANAICNGAVPWRQEDVGGNGPDAAQRHYGQLYRRELNQLKRSEEEDSILRVEAVRLVNGIEERMEYVESSIEMLRCMWREESEEVAEGHGMVASEQNQLENHQVEGSMQVEQHTEAMRRRRERAVGEGKIALLNLELQRLECILEDAKRRLKPFYPASPPRQGDGVV